MTGTRATRVVPWRERAADGTRRGHGTYAFWSDADLQTLAELRGRKCTPSAIAHVLRCTRSRVVDKIKALGFSGTGFDGRRMHAGEELGPAIESGHPFTDDLPDCDDRWREFLRGRRYESLNIKPTLCVHDSAAPLDQAREITR